MIGFFYWTYIMNETKKIIKDQNGIYWEVQKILDPYFWDDDELLCSDGDWFRKIKEAENGQRRIR